MSKKQELINFIKEYKGKVPKEVTDLLEEHCVLLDDMTEDQLNGWWTNGAACSRIGEVSDDFIEILSDGYTVRDFRKEWKPVSNSRVLKELLG